MPFKKIILIFTVASFMVSISGLFVFWYYDFKNGGEKRNETSAESGSQLLITGVISEVISSLSVRAVVVKDNYGRETNFIFAPDIKLFNKNSKEVDISYFKNGFTVLGRGMEIKNGFVLIKELRILMD